MCGICGCSNPSGTGKFSVIDASKVSLLTTHNHGHSQHNHADTQRLIQVEQDLLRKNDAYAAENRTYFQDNKIFALNLVSSPGAGKTTLLVETIKVLKDKFSIAVIEGDQQTEHDADRIRATGVPALQINTGRACHLDAHGIGQAIKTLGVKENSFLAIENVGNLVCPSSFDLGEAHKVVVLSVTEGDDKPLKYPDMFYAADLMIINKIDLLPYVDFDVERCIDFARRVNPTIQILQLSATKGDNFSAWTDWLTAKIL
ncbi:MAG: hydrogenase nickel incorporation protein HypB [Methylococcales bacterium]|nr:hydrogenase nickel incorporation protein HypB [Methylococcales bacterium]MDD5753759.1 hydrogenase nickel incorporation protein HypB [Methylococcales bacterium]